MDDVHAPFLARALRAFPRAEIRTLPSSELSSTIFTGTYPGTHGRWHVRLRDDAPRSTPWWLRHVPDAVSTTLQGLLRASGIGRDALATIPHRRLRQLEPRRYKYGVRGRRREDLLAVGGVPTLFTALGFGEGRARYRFHRDVRTITALAPDMGVGRYRLDFLESRALDIFQHWSLDRPEAVRAAYRAFDTRIATLFTTCRVSRSRLLVLSDHGHERVRASIDLRPILRDAGVSREGYTFFLEPSMARFWFHDASTRERLTTALRRVPQVTVLAPPDLARYHLDVGDGGFGHLFLSPLPGIVFFPHDFHQPLANAFLALTDRTMRHRLRNPCLRGDHAYLPENPSERGFVVLLDERFEPVREQAELIDVAPTLLSLAGESTPTHMRGSPIFRPAPQSAGRDDGPSGLPPISST